MLCRKSLATRPEGSLSHRKCQGACEISTELVVLKAQQDAPKMPSWRLRCHPIHQSVSTLDNSRQSTPNLYPLDERIRPIVWRTHSLYCIYRTSMSGGRVNGKDFAGIAFLVNLGVRILMICVERVGLILYALQEILLIGEKQKNLSALIHF